MAQLLSGDRRLADITNCSSHGPTIGGRTLDDLCGEWTYEYKTPYCPYSNQYTQETYLLLSCGLAYQSTIDQYDEGNHYFVDRKTSGWGSWFVNLNGDLVITCSSIMTSQLGGSMCGDDQPSWTDNKDMFFKSSSTREFRKRWADFIVKYTKARSLDDVEEEKLRAQALQQMEFLPIKFDEPQAEEDSSTRASDFSTSLDPEKPSYQDHFAYQKNTESSRPAQKMGALCGLRRLFSGSKRRRAQ